MQAGTMQRYSKKRQAIIDYMQSTNCHPTAERVYEHLREQYPDLSLATVYRNLNQLKEAGLVRSMGVLNDHEHFDAKMEPHSHAVCTGCGAIMDLDDMKISEEVIAKVEHSTCYQIAEVSLQFTGLCRECLKKRAE